MRDRAEPSDATDVEVRFTDLGGTTRVEIEHSAALDPLNEMMRRLVMAPACALVGRLVGRPATDQEVVLRTLMIYLAPVLPEMATKSARFFGESVWTWSSAATPVLGTSIQPYEALATRLDAKAVANLIEPVAADAPASPATPAAASSRSPRR